MKLSRIFLVFIGINTALAGEAIDVSRLLDSKFFTQSEKELIKKYGSADWLAQSKAQRLKKGASQFIRHMLEVDGQRIRERFRIVHSKTGQTLQELDREIRWPDSRVHLFQNLRVWEEELKNREKE